LFVVAGVEHAGVQQVGDVAGARGVHLVLPGDAAEQAHITVAQQRGVFLQALAEQPRGGLGIAGHIVALAAAHLVHDQAGQVRVARAAEQLSKNLDAVGQLAHGFVIRRGDEDHFGIHAARQVRVDACGVAGVLGRHHAFDDHHVLVRSGVVVHADDVFEQFVEQAVAEHALDFCQRQRRWGVESVGARDQFAGALGAIVPCMGLGDGLEEADLQTGALQGADQAQAGGRQADTETGRREKEGVHPGSLSRAGMVCALVGRNR